MSVVSPSPQDTSPRLASTERLLQLLLVAALLLYAVNLIHYRAYLLDDSFISLRYAHNWVAGHGLVFNPGERVEGYTNFLFVLVAALFLKLGIDPITGLKVVGVALSLSLLWLMAQLERRGTTTADVPWNVPVSVLLLAPLQAFAYWSVCPMETVWFAALLLLGVTLSVDAPGSLGATLVFVLLSLTRPEGVYLFAVWTLILLCLDLRLHRRLRPLRYGRSGALFVVLFGAYFAWRYLYYGSWLPNTFYAKVTGDGGQLASGLAYFKEWLLAFPLLAGTLFLPAAVLPARWRAGTELSRIAVAVYLLSVAYTAYVIVIGGDFMPFFRFFLPALPLYCLLVAWTVRRVLARARSRAWVATVLVCIGLVHLACSSLTEQPYRAFIADRTAVVGRRVGAWFKQHLAPDDLIAVNTAGSVPYYSDLPAIDMLGLTDAHIAHRPVYIISPHWAGHRRGWGAYVFSRRPRVILWYNSAGSRAPYYLGDHELADNPFFRFFYTPRRAQLSAAQPVDAAHPVESFFGFPFGHTEAGTLESGDLGLRMVFRRSPIPRTTLYDAPIVLNYFEMAGRDAELWDLIAGTHARVDAFVDAVSQRWQQNAGQGSSDTPARRRVEVLCAEAHRRIEANDYRGAREILTAAARQNETARSPLVYQYMANLAVLTNDLFAAIQAQKEALRLAPDTLLYRTNLVRLLVASYKEGLRPQIEAGNRAGGAAHEPRH